MEPGKEAQLRKLKPSNWWPDHTQSTSISGVQRHVVMLSQCIAKMSATYWDYCASLRDLTEHLPRNSFDVVIVMVHQVEVWHHKGHLGARHARCHECQIFVTKELCWKRVSICHGFTLLASVGICWHLEASRIPMPRCAKSVTHPSNIMEMQMFSDLCTCSYRFTMVQHGTPCSKLKKKCRALPFTGTK